MAFFGEFVVATEAALFGLFVGLDEALVLLGVECRVKGAFLEVEDALGFGLDFLGDVIAVFGPAFEDLEDEWG